MWFSVLFYVGELLVVVTPLEETPCYVQPRTKLARVDVNDLSTSYVMEPRCNLSEGLLFGRGHIRPRPMPRPRLAKSGAGGVKGFAPHHVYI